MFIKLRPKIGASRNHPLLHEKRFRFALIAARFDPSMGPLLPLLGKVRNATSAKAQRVLGWTPRPREDAVVSTAESLVRLGLVGTATQS